MRIDESRAAEERETDRAHSQKSYRLALAQAVKRLRDKYLADIGGGNSYPLITWSGDRPKPKEQIT